jgi:hypothetical protein
MASIREQSLNLQHDLNCLTIAGADRFKRRQAVLQLRAKLASMQVIGRLDQANEDSRDELILELLSKPLIITLNDPAESCRSAALDLLREYAFLLIIAFSNHFSHFPIIFHVFQSFFVFSNHFSFFPSFSPFSYRFFRLFQSLFAD